MIGNFSLETMTQGSELAQLSYGDPDNRSSDISGGFKPGFTERFDYSELYNKDGDEIYGFKDRDDGELFVVARGTDNFWDDGRQWDDVLYGTISPIGRAMADSVERWSAQNGNGKVIAMGHSLGGHAAEQAGRLVDPNILEGVINYQGPSVVDKTWGIWETELGKLDPHPNTVRVTADSYDRDALGFAQRALDRLGIDGPRPQELAIDVGGHRMNKVNEWFEGEYERQTGRDAESLYQAPEVTATDTEVAEMLYV